MASIDEELNAAKAAKAAIEMLSTTAPNPSIVAALRDARNVAGSAMTFLGEGPLNDARDKIGIALSILIRALEDSSLATFLEVQYSRASRFYTSSRAPAPAIALRDRPYHIAAKIGPPEPFFVCLEFDVMREVRCDVTILERTTRPRAFAGPFVLVLDRI
jgi:hypothetical protein